MIDEGGDPPMKMKGKADGMIDGRGLISHGCE